MKHPTRPNASDCFRRRGGLGFLPATVSCLAFLTVLTTLGAATGGCSPEKRYQVLSFFFDGVPDPNAPPVAVDDEGNPIEGPGFVGGTGNFVRAVVHKPFADNDCASCHGANTGKFEDFQKVESNVCGKCHAQVATQFPVMHGPVAVGECNLCHAPHESTVKHLLKEESPAVCTQCHLPELLPAEPPDHVAATRSCLDCHMGHGGHQRGLLRADYTPGDATTRPATQPATQPATAPFTASSAPLRQRLLQLEGAGS